MNTKAKIEIIEIIDIDDYKIGSYLILQCSCGGMYQFKATMINGDIIKCPQCNTLFSINYQEKIVEAVSINTNDGARK